MSSPLVTSFKAVVDPSVRGPWTVVGVLALAGMAGGAAVKGTLALLVGPKLPGQGTIEYARESAREGAENGLFAGLGIAGLALAAHRWLA